MAPSHDFRVVTEEARTAYHAVVRYVREQPDGTGAPSLLDRVARHDIDI